ncbi:MAG TPA: hypothetical protein VFW28_08450 [Micropepsaceae bacterium]|nr:hypothetical protein [Micropepsaceae bacterium]
MNDVDRALRYRNLAEEIRMRAGHALTDQTRQIFLRVAQDYDTMAKSIEQAEQNRPR